MADAKTHGLVVPPVFSEGTARTFTVRSLRVGLAVGVALLLLLATLSALAVKAEAAPLNTYVKDEAESNARFTEKSQQAPPHRLPPSPCPQAPEGFTLIENAGTLPNGVAAGDTAYTSTVLWTRATTVGQVLFEYSVDPTFVTGVLTATALVTNPLQPVKIGITGLDAATAYAYRATDAAGASAEGRFRTAATVGVYAGLRFGVSGDWCGGLAPYPSISNADERDLNFFVEHGDTIVAESPPPAATTLEEYRLRHNQVYSTHLGLNTWADLRGSTAILATIDDNDVRDSFAGGAPPSSDPRFDNTGAFINETQLYGNALQAFQEYNPLLNEFYGDTGDPRTTNKRQLYRFQMYGNDVAVFLLDTRSFRDEPLPLDDPTDPVQVVAFLTNSLNDASRTLLGAQQLADLKADLQRAHTDGITWKFILVSGPIQNLGVFHAEDRYEGYAAERTDLLRFITQNGIDNVVFIAASLHGTIVNNLTYQEALFGPQIPTKAFEVIVGPVAIDPPFGPAVIDLAEDFGLITPEERATYDGLSRDGKDEFVRQLVDEKLLDPLGYDPVGLDGSGIEATLLQGGYVAVHTYGWSEFEINQSTQVLTVTTYGIDPYTEAELADHPNDVITRTPTVVSQFIVTPTMATDWVTVTAVTDAAGIYPGDTATFTLSVTASEGFTAPVTLALRGEPSETTVSFDPNPVALPGISQLVISTTTSTVVGTYLMTVTGTSGEVSGTTYLTLTVNPTLYLSTQPSVRTILPGGAAAYTLSVIASEGFTTPVSLTLQGEPSDATVSFDPNPVTPPGTSQLVITTTPSTIAGTYPVMVTGTSGEVSNTTRLTLIVNSPTLDLVAQPGVRTVLPGDSAAYTVVVSATEGFSAPVTLTLEGEPSGASVAFSPNPITSPGISQLVITTTSSTIAGTYLMLVNGTAGTVTDTVSLTLVVTLARPSFTLSISPTTRTAKPDQEVTYTALVTSANQLIQPVSLTVIGLPTGIGTAWSTNPVTPDNSSQLTLSIPSDPLFGDHPFQVVGIAETLTVTENVKLVIEYPKLYLPTVLRSV